MPCDSKSCFTKLLPKQNRVFDWARAIMIHEWQANYEADWARCALSLRTSVQPTSRIILPCLLRCSWSRGVPGLCRCPKQRHRTQNWPLGTRWPINLAMSRSLERLGLGALPRVIKELASLPKGHSPRASVKVVMSVGVHGRRRSLQ